MQTIYGQFRLADSGGAKTQKQTNLATTNPGSILLSVAHAAQACSQGIVSTHLVHLHKALYGVSVHFARWKHQSPHHTSPELLALPLSFRQCLRRQNQSQYHRFTMSHSSKALCWHCTPPLAAAQSQHLAEDAHPHPGNSRMPLHLLVTITSHTFMSHAPLFELDVP